MKILDRLFGSREDRFDKTPADLEKGADGVESMTDSAPPKQLLHEPCAKCGGFFRSDMMQRVYHVVVPLFRSVKNTEDIATPYVESTFYCQNCAPHAPLVLVLREPDGEHIDTRHLQVDNGWFQEVDDEGELRHVIDSDEFTRLYCVECGGYTHDEGVECKDCVAREKKSKGKK
ncbi:hypothetical protein LCGC14_2151100 [marine sediment metagenome]|uniref:Uncharacterized protein n=1 Tax=marine sediment metagenome TaxID=412755 RepID=A0A0F9DVG3_9ZZZZ